MPKKTITIEVNFGSDFQVGPPMRMLEQYLEEWAAALPDHHKDNHAIWTVTDGTTEARPA